MRSCSEVRVLAQRFQRQSARYLHESKAGAMQAAGEIWANFYLAGGGRNINRLGGHGSIEMRKADLFRLPILLDLFDILGLKAPDGQVFDKAVATFRLDDKRLIFKELELTSPVIDLVMDNKRGKPGTVELDTSRIDIPLSVRIGQARGQLHIPVFSDVLNLATNELLGVRVEGTLASPKVIPEPLSGVRGLLTRPGEMLNPNRRRERAIER